MTVRFEVIPGNATASVDYFFTSNNVILSDMETSKQVCVCVVYVCAAAAAVCL